MTYLKLRFYGCEQSRQGTAEPYEPWRMLSFLVLCVASYSNVFLLPFFSGLWVIYSTEDSAGKIVISKLNPHSLVLEKTWLTSFPKKFVGNTFMVCGVLYATNSFKDTPTFVRYTYDTSSLQGAIHDAGHIIFNNAVMFNSSQQASSIMLDYNPKEHRLYSWSNAQIQTFPVYFKRKE